MEQFVNKYGVLVIINNEGDVYLKYDIDSDTEIELTFDSVEEAEEKLQEDIKDISEVEMIDYQNNNEENDFDLEDCDTD